MWRVRLYLDLDSVKLVGIALVFICLDCFNSLLYCIADTVLTKLQCVQNWLARIVTKSPPFTLTISLLCSLHWLPVKFRILFKVSLLTYKNIDEKQPVFLHSVLSTSLPSRSLRSSKGISLSVSGSRPTQTQSYSLMCPASGTTCHGLSVQPFQLLPSRNIWRYISLTGPFPLRHWHIQQPIDAMELLHRFCYWTLIRLSCHWAWPLLSYWCYRNLIDWLISSLQFSSHNFTLRP